MPKLTTLLLASILAVSSSACVSKSTHKKVLDELAACQGELGSCQTTSGEQADKITKLEADLVETRGNLDSESAARKQADEDLAALSSNLQATQEELGVLRKQREATEKRLKAFRELTEKFRSLVDTGKLEVVFRNGQMVLKLPAGILFASGKADLSKQGKGALGEVTDVLVEFKDRRFMIAGHTDDVKIKTRKFKNNWDLSTARAISVVQFMIDAGFAAENLAAAGYGEFDPVAPNDTTDGRQLNRRIEIVLVPDLSELPTLTEEPAGG
jgi:chemotaxis protein MotB